MFLPTTSEELQKSGIDQLDIILVTGDAYIDSPFMGVSLVGRMLESKGFSVGIIAQPCLDTDKDISRLGEPRLFWGITAGAVDSMVANYTASKKRRKQDDYTPGGTNNKRPDRATIVYTNLVRHYFKPTAPIVLGGIEASLRRIAHYDFWSNKIRRSILLDTKADYLLFGMAHKGIVSLARALKRKAEADHTPDLQIEDEIREIPGIGYVSNTPEGICLPSFEEVSADKDLYIQSFMTFYANTEPSTAMTISQAHANRFIVLNPPAQVSSTQEMDAMHDLKFQRDLHPYYKAQGSVRALETIRFSIPTHYGCYGECNFCAITVHQGRTVSFRSKASILAEAKKMTEDKDFKGYIFDLGGPTANMYGYECKKKLKKGACSDRRCLFPSPCPSLKPDHTPQMALLSAIERLPKIKKVFINSGIRYDLILQDTKKGHAYLKQLVQSHVSGQMKIAPEHTQPRVLSLMGKQTVNDLLAFKDEFYQINSSLGKKQFLTYYLIAAHPGCTAEDMRLLKKFTREKLKTSPEQVQIFTPTPSTFSTLMYYTEKNPFTMDPLFVEKDPRAKEKQKQVITAKPKRYTGPKKKHTHPTPLGKNPKKDKGGPDWKPNHL
ncbi:MAG: YgiQ family radical SAM protein [Desulfobacter sp.]|nr:YgiQ family radical SAM protein [Desulfobacter sp.]WDP84554.1 MAG: YgiQ family radical SAM protein [Desulfobacter sp.]